MNEVQANYLATKTAYEIALAELEASTGLTGRALRTMIYTSVEGSQAYEVSRLQMVASEAKTALIEWGISEITRLDVDLGAKYKSAWLNGHGTLKAKADFIDMVMRYQ